jgi:thiazole synthase
MKVIVNGEEREVGEEIVLSELIETLGLALTRVAVELNGRIVAPDDYRKTPLGEGDRLEVVGFVGGG